MLTTDWRSTLLRTLLSLDICSTAHLQRSRKLQMEHLPPPLAPALGSKSQYNLLREWIMFMSHCFLNCAPAPRAIKPKQNNCQRLLHLCRAPAGIQQLIMAECQMHFFALKNQLTATCRLAVKLVLQFHSFMWFSYILNVVIPWRSGGSLSHKKC